MGLNGDFMGLNGDFMGLNGDFMGFNGDFMVVQLEYDGNVMSIDWFEGKSQPQTIDCPIQYGGFRFQFSLRPIH